MRSANAPEHSRTLGSSSQSSRRPTQMANGPGPAKGEAPTGGPVGRSPRPGGAESVRLAAAIHRPALPTTPTLTSRNQSPLPRPTQLGETMQTRRGGVMLISGPQPQNRCPRGLQRDRRVGSSESGWTRPRSMHALSVVRNAMDYFQTDPPTPSSGTFLERTFLPLSTSGVCQGRAVASRAALVVRSWNSLSLEIPGDLSRLVCKRWEGKVSIKIKIPSPLQSWILEKASRTETYLPAVATRITGSVASVFCGRSVVQARVSPGDGE